MENKIGFLETWNARSGRVEKSNSRLIADIVIFFAIFLAIMLAGTVCKVAWVNNSIEGLIGAGAAIGTTFVTIGGAAMVFIFNQKKTESGGQKQDKEIY